MKKVITLLAVIAIIALPFTAFAEHWGEVQLKYMVNNGYLSDGDPNEAITRLEVAKAFAKLPLIDKGSNYIFTDTSHKDVVKVSKAGLMNGGRQPKIQSGCVYYAGGNSEGYSIAVTQSGVV